MLSGELDGEPYNKKYLENYALWESLTIKEHTRVNKHGAKESIILMLLFLCSIVCVVVVVEHNIPIVVPFLDQTPRQHTTSTSARPKHKISISVTMIMKTSFM